jgi:hypothetical protein
MILNANCDSSGSFEIIETWNEEQEINLYA